MAIRGQGLREVYEITEMRDGCVFRTRQVARVWVWLDVPDSELRMEGLKYGSVSNSYDGPTIRSVIVSTTDKPSAEQGNKEKMR